MLRLKETPDISDISTWEDGTLDDRSADFILWQAEDDDRPVKIRISLRELAEFSGSALPIGDREAETALNRSKDAIEIRAGEKYSKGDRVVTIEPGDLLGMRSIWRL